MRAREGVETGQQIQVSVGKRETQQRIPAGTPRQEGGRASHSGGDSLFDTEFIVL